MHREFRFLFPLVVALMCGALQMPACLLAQGNRSSDTAASAGKVIVSKTAGTKLSFVPAGAFSMGSLSSEDGHSQNEDQHVVQISRPVYVGVCEVTQAEFQLVMETNPSAFCKTGIGAGRVNDVDTSRLPVENVSWFDAIEFCNALSKKDGLQAYYGLANIERADGSIRSAVVSIAGGDGYRLPTEAEWEYACRAGIGSPYGEGHTIASLDRVGWFGGNQTQAGNSDKQSHRVGQKRANEFGLFDLHGNVSEWCQDWNDYGYYDRSPRNDPPGPTGGSTRVVRGGSWNDEASACRAAHRAGSAPNHRASSTGFRVVRSFIPPTTRRNPAGVPPYRIVVNLRDGDAVDVYKNESFDSLDSAKQRLAGSKFFGRVGNIRIIDGNGNQVE